MKQALYVWVVLMSLITFTVFGIDKWKAENMPGESVRIH